MPLYSQTTATCGRRPRPSGTLAFARAHAPVSHAANRSHTQSGPAEKCSTFFKALDNALRGFLHSNSLKYLIAGALAGVVSKTVVSPLEVVATVNMCSSGASRPLLIELQALFAAEGLRGFFKGNAANCLKVAPTKGIQFVAFEAFKRLIYRMRSPSDHGDGPVPLRPIDRLAAGGAAGMAAASLCYPLEVVKTLLTAHPERYHGVFGTLAAVARTSGPKGLYRGLLPTLIAMFPYVGLELMVYEQLKLMYTQYSNREAGVLQLLLIGAFAGSLAQTTCHPLDVVRKRLQLQGIGGRPVQYKSMIDATVSIVRNEGPHALWRGLKPLYVSVLPSTGVSYVVYETTKNMLGASTFR